MTSVRDLWLVAFGVMALTHLYLLTGDIAIWGTVTKITLMPLLAMWAFSRAAPTLLIAALMFSTIGDLAMDFEALFLVGMTGFALAHVCYISLFVRRGAVAAMGDKPWIPLVYAIAAGAFITYVWSAPPMQDVRFAIPVYGALLAATAATSMSLDVRAGIGGTLFMISDAIIALEVAELPRPHQASLLIMAFYIVGQYLLVSTVLDRDEQARAEYAH